MCYVSGVARTSLWAGRDWGIGLEHVFNKYIFLNLQLYVPRTCKVRGILWDLRYMALCSLMKKQPSQTALPKRSVKWWLCRSDSRTWIGKLEPVSTGDPLGREGDCGGTGGQPGRCPENCTSQCVSSMGQGPSGRVAAVSGVSALCASRWSVSPRLTRWRACALQWVPYV